MLKKLYIFFIIFVFSWFISVFAIWEKAAYEAVRNNKESTASELKAAKEAYDNSEESSGDATSRWFIISVDDISSGMWVNWASTKENVNFLLWTIIQNLMVVLWSLALFIMTIWAWFILLHHGEDGVLTKWKDIFLSWIYALIIALSSYYLISIIVYLLYWNS